MHQRQRFLLLTLLSLLMTAARAAESRKVTIIPSENGVIEASVPEAVEGQTVTLTIFPAEGYWLSGLFLLSEPIVEPEDSQGGMLTRYALPDIGGSVEVIPTAENVYTFQMPAHDVEISGRFCRPLTTEGIRVTKADSQTQQVKGTEMVVTVSNEDKREVTIERVLLPDALQEDVAVYIPQTVKGEDGMMYSITAISPFAFLGQDNLTDVWLPDTSLPLVIGKNAFRLEIGSGAGYRLPTLHVPLGLLDDYALMRTLEDMYESCRIQSQVNVPNRYWTFSCGVDVFVPEGTVLYTLSKCNESVAMLTKQDGEYHELSGKHRRVIKANNGVILDGIAGSNYIIIVCPSDERPSGMVPPTHDARSYEDGNLLEPVVEARHFDRGEYYILHNGEFCPILQEDSSAQVPACKAVLHLKRGNTRSLIIQKDSMEEKM